MARPLRLESEDGVYHVLNRGNYRADLFRGILWTGSACYLLQRADPRSLPVDQTRIRVEYERGRRRSLYFIFAVRL